MWRTMMNNLQPTYRRQRFLLDFIRQLENGVTNTELQKLVFMHTMKNKTDLYEFIPYKFGAYSFQLAEDLDILNKDEYLVLGETRVKAAGEYSQTNLFNIETERGNDLIRKAYREYPYYTINSETINNLFYGTEAEQFNSVKQKYIQSEQSLFTIGYEGKSIEAFINSLIVNGVNLLCDVRKNPLSRKFGFSKGKLEHITDTVGIKYVHIPDLGIESDKRNSLETAEDYHTLFNEYAETLPTLERYLEQIYSLLKSNNRIALMCYEKDAVMCHRHVIRDYITNAHEVRSEDL
ncbi:MAG: DUF488 domain-containing protein [Oscillospiraceae bacterium]|nr:DUF488 domain-containing protein [Oscillospiraceae bacterium]